MTELVPQPCFTPDTLKKKKWRREKVRKEKKKMVGEEERERERDRERKYIVSLLAQAIYSKTNSHT